MAKWVTVDAFELQTGIRREEAQRNVGQMNGLKALLGCTILKR